MAEQIEAEVEVRAERRHYTAEYKRQVLEEIDAAREPGEIGAVLRREGLYSQLISKWRQQRQEGGLERLKGQARGPKGDVVQAAELARLKRENERLRQRLERAELIIEVQKKVSQMLGVSEEKTDQGRAK
jgi:transposase-like protein